MASRMPAVPRFIFTVLEPVSLIAGAVPAVLWPAWFTAQQVSHPNASAVAQSADEGAQLVAGQLGNAYALFFLMVVMVLCVSSESRVVRNYLAALMVGDLGHIVVTYRVLGWERFAAVGAWNATTWGNIGAAVLLFFTRAGYLLGAFGPDISADARVGAEVDGKVDGKSTKLH